MRQILLHNDIKSTQSLNCIELDNDPIGAVFDILWKQKRKENMFTADIDVDILYNNDELPEEFIIPSHLADISENIIYYIAGYIARKLQNIDCYNCSTSLIQSKQEHDYTHRHVLSTFIDHSTRGGLLYPSRSVHKIVIATEKEIQVQTFDLTDLTNKNIIVRILNKIKLSLALDETIFPNLTCDDVDLLETSHRLKLITAVSYRYIKIRFHSFAKFYNQEILAPIRKRHRLTKQILF